tara:strand:- start:3582 stop:5390 length:1809 start_codon:yes stop_codon:yes gene_type:complete
LKTNNSTTQNKRKILTRVFLGIFFIIILRYFHIQIIESKQFFEDAVDNSIRKIRSIPPRGIIYDRNSRVIVSNRSSFSIKIYPHHYNDSFDSDLLYKMIYSAEKRSKLLVEESNFLDTIQSNKSRRHKKYKAINIINYIDFKTKALLSEYKNSFPGLLFSSNPARVYLDSLKLSHILGYLRPVPDSLVRAKIYDINDIKGISGIEKIYENKLKGKKGVEAHIINTFGKKLGIDKGRSISYVAGEDIYLSIDYNLQKKIENLLEGHKGAVICMNPSNGEVLAMASAPNYDLSQFIGPLKTEVWKAWNKEKRLMNRATAGKYHPGSLYKLVSSIMFIDQQLIPTKEKVFCNGKYELEDQSNPGVPKIYRCWKAEGHGDVDLYEAIKQSCNVYFYDMILKYQSQDRYIIDLLSEYANKLGFDQKIGIDIFEQKGRIPDSEWMVDNYGKSWPKRGAMPSLIIGQGENEITPLQAINLINLIAMRGEAYKPRLVLNEPLEPIEVKISKYVWDEIQKAMYGVVNEENGTGTMLKRKDEIVRGKTGTAQTKSSTTDQLLSWFGGYIETDKNLMSLVVLIEDTDSKTKYLAKQISKEIFDYYISMEIDDE